MICQPVIFKKAKKLAKILSRQRYGKRGFERACVPQYGLYMEETDSYTDLSEK